MSNNTDDDVLASFERIAGFEPVICCDERAGVINTRPFTAAAGKRFEQIRQRHVSVEDPLGNSFQDDPAWHALRADPNSFGPVEEGYRFGFTCRTCGASFMQQGGKPTRVPREIC